MARTSIRITLDETDTTIELTPIKATKTRNVFEYEVESEEEKIHMAIYQNAVQVAVFTMTRDDCKTLQETFNMVGDFL